MKSLNIRKTSESSLISKLKKKKNNFGYLPYQLLKDAYSEEMITSESPILNSQFQPASIDLRLGEKAYRIQCSFLPENETVEKKLKDLTLYEFDISKEGILEREAIYLIPLMEELHLPETFFGLANPKSSTGRLDMFTRVIVDRGHRFDEIRKGYKGKLYLEIIPRSFTVKVKSGLSLNQLRIAFSKSETLGRKNLAPYYKKIPILYHRDGFQIPLHEFKFDSGVYISVDLSGKEKDSIIAYKAKNNSNIIDLTKTDYYDPLDFWEPIRRPPNKRFILEPESFYIMMSKERICIPPGLLAEMIAYEPNSGELRTHYAGFFDPGFGYYESENGIQHGTHAVMEVRPHDVPFMVEDGQTFCRLKFEKLIEPPEMTYGRDIASHYHSQELALSKYFKS